MSSALKAQKSVQRHQNENCCLLTTAPTHLPIPTGILFFRRFLIGALALQGGPIFWVAGHRLHHAYTEDIDKDPYSAQRGFWWSYGLWLMHRTDHVFSYEGDSPGGISHLW